MASIYRGGHLASLPMKLPSSKEAHMKAIAVGLEATNAIQLSPICANPMIPMVVTLAIFKATLYSPFVVPKDKE